MEFICSTGNHIETYKTATCQVIKEDGFGKNIKRLQKCHTQPYIFCVLDDNSIVLYNYMSMNIVYYNSLFKEESPLLPPIIDVTKNDKNVILSNHTSQSYVISLCDDKYMSHITKEFPKRIIECDDSYIVLYSQSMLELEKEDLTTISEVNNTFSTSNYLANSTLYFSKEISQENFAICKHYMGKESVILENIANYGSYLSSHSIYSNFICIDDTSLICAEEDRVIYKCKNLNKVIAQVENTYGFMVLSPNKKYIAVVESAEMLIIDIDTLSVKHRLKRKRGIENISISSDSNLIALVDKSSSFFIFNVETGEIVSDIIKDDESFFYFAEFTNKQEKIILASRNNVIRVYDMTVKKITQVICSDSQNYNLRGFSKQSMSSDGNYMLATVTNNDTTLVVIELKHFNTIATYNYHNTYIKSAIFAEDDKYIVSISSDGQIIKNEFKPLQELIDYNSKRFVEREFTDIEKKKYYID